MEDNEKLLKATKERAKPTTAISQLKLGGLEGAGPALSSVDGKQLSHAKAVSGMTVRNERKNKDTLR